MENEYSALSRFAREDVKAVGMTLLESMKKDPKYKPVLESMAEKIGVAVESLDVSNSTLYSTAMAGFIEKRLRPVLVAEQVIKKISGFKTQGYNSIKIPLRNALITAADLPDSGQLSYDTGTYGSTTITLGYKYAANSITHEIMKFANVDLISEELGEIGSAIARKMDADIIAALQTYSTTALGNRSYLGATATITFSSILSALSTMTATNYAIPDVILTNHSTYYALMGLVQFIGNTTTPGSLTFKGGETGAFPLPREILGMRVVLSQQVDADDTYLIDTARCGYLVEAGETEVFDGRRTGYLAYEVIGAKNYGVGIVQPKAIYRIEENAAS